MTVESIGAVSAKIEVDGLLPASAVQTPAAGFAQWFAQEVGAVNTSIVNSDNDIKKLITGESQSLHEVMLHMEEAKLSFQLLAQVRNRLLESYQEVMRMSV